MAPIMALCTALALPAVAGEIDAGTGLPVRLDVLDGGMTERGTYVAALRLQLSDGWKTYWRSPGDAGIPPGFDWRGSRNLGKVTITWPTPEVFDQGGMQSIGYSRELVLPVEITPTRADRPVRLKGSVDLGLCKDICIPGQLHFDHKVDAGAARNPAIAAALAQRPYSAAEAGVRAATCRLTPTADGLRIEARITMPSAGKPEVAVIESGNPALWVSETSTSRAGEVLTAAADLVAGDGGGVALDRGAVRITVLGRDHAVDIQGCTPG
jgi:DsbC/DsbD-like thiol-disulfide interchange protein